MQEPTVTTPRQPAPPMVEYAGFWRRLAAWVIDAILLAIIGSILNLLTDRRGVEGVISLLIGWVYYAVMESSPRQATLGKMALSIVVTDINGRQLSFGRATGRYFAKILSTVILLIGFIMIAFTVKKQGLHDKLAETLVVVRRQPQAG